MTQVPFSYPLTTQLSSIDENDKPSFNTIFKTTAKLCRDYADYNKDTDEFNTDPVSERIKNYILSLD